MNSGQENDRPERIRATDLFRVKVGLAHNYGNFDVRLDLHLLTRLCTRRPPLQAGTRGGL